MSKTLKIDGMEFTVHRTKYYDESMLSRCAGRTIYDCYGRPSGTKVSIYNDWLQWACRNNVEYFGVSSYNTFGFSLQGLVEIEGVTYMLRISPSYNKAYII